MAKRETVMFKRHANQAPPQQQQQQQQQHANLSHISQPLLNSYIGSAIRWRYCTSASGLYVVNVPRSCSYLL